MTKDEFDALLMCCRNDEDILDFARKFIIHGIPYVFNGREDEFLNLEIELENIFPLTIIKYIL